MKDATKCGIAQKCKMDTREEITEDEEAILIKKNSVQIYRTRLVFIKVKHTN